CDCFVKCPEPRRQSPMEECLVEMQVRLDKAWQRNTSFRVDFVRTRPIEMLFDRGNPSTADANIDTRLLIIEPDSAYNHIHGAPPETRVYRSVNAASPETGGLRSGLALKRHRGPSLKADREMRTELGRELLPSARNVKCSST